MSTGRQNNKRLRELDHTCNLKGLVEIFSFKGLVERACVCVYSTRQKSGHTFSFNGFSLFLLCSILYINTEDIRTMEEHIWNYVVNKKVLNKPEYVIYFRFFKVATFCFDDSFANS